MQVLQSLLIQTLSKLCLCTSSIAHLKAWASAWTRELVPTLALKANNKFPLQSLAIKAMTDQLRPVATSQLILIYIIFFWIQSVAASVNSSRMIHIIVTHYSPMINELSLGGSFQFFNRGHPLLMNCFISQVLDEIQDSLEWVCFKHLTFVLYPTLVRNKPCYKFISLCIS